ncbi:MULTISPECIES: hypothetical protein [Methylobacterium]|uniref:hypothetical protein n=1 Tax=Methylobacterium TaxID=407 RepID=UPI0011C6EE49|nr:MULTISPECIES: hypothetical protein [Methylobacterium]TXN46240.1 hypothetical protein FV233_08645 [Methylobacterium sp. WL7]TXN65699.1 hypothetical protein FV228_15450 [Methylobacterium sp. WL18]GJE21962.1 hypothetical protein JHFBIEKO_2412 [Methylobacterium mesophilicum]
MRLIAFGLIAMVAAAAAPARAREDDAVQRMLDAMTSYDLCARNDVQLRRLNRSLAATPVRHPAPLRVR